MSEERKMTFAINVTLDGYTGHGREKTRHVEIQNLLHLT
jgi:hypothetical protein